MSKERLGYIYHDPKTGKWIARISFTNNLGKRQNLKRQADSEAKANKVLKQLRNELSSQKAREQLSIQSMTFDELEEKYSAKKIRPAEYRGDKKICGMRHYDKVLLRLKPLKAYFGKMKLSSITPEIVEDYKESRLRTKTKFGTDRSIADVHRELEILRAMLRFAKALGLIQQSPFEKATSPLIKKSDEVKRTRILSREEEDKLLEACEDTVRRHLRPLIIAALDCGARKGELLTLVWDDVDLESRLIHLKAINTKTLEARSLPITDRLAIELERLKTEFPDRERVFGIGTKFQHSWETACKKAQITNLHFHDLRHSFATRLLDLGMELGEIAKLTGHSDINTLYRIYINVTPRTIQKARELLNKDQEGK
jgi:integrase